MSTVKNCECKKEHEYQDKKYGKGKRVVIPIPHPTIKNKVEYRCTVCGIDLKSETTPENK